MAAFSEVECPLSKGELSPGIVTVYKWVADTLNPSLQWVSLKSNYVDICLYAFIVFDTLICIVFDN